MIDKDRMALEAIDKQPAILIEPDKALQVESLSEDTGLAKGLVESETDYAIKKKEDEIFRSYIVNANTPAKLAYSDLDFRTKYNNQYNEVAALGQLLNIEEDAAKKKNIRPDNEGYGFGGAMFEYGISLLEDPIKTVGDTGSAVGGGWMAGEAMFHKSFQSVLGEYGFTESYRKQALEKSKGWQSYIEAQAKGGSGQPVDKFLGDMSAQLPRMGGATIVAGAAAALAPASASAAATVGMFAYYQTLMTGDTAGDIREIEERTGVELAPLERMAIANTSAAAQAALETIPQMLGLKALQSGAGKSVQGLLSKSGFTKKLTEFITSSRANVGAGMAGGATSEGITEFTQTFISETTKAAIDPTRELFDDQTWAAATEAGEQGAAMGSFFGGGVDVQTALLVKSGELVVDLDKRKAHKILLKSAEKTMLAGKSQNYMEKISAVVENVNKAKSKSPNMSSEQAEKMIDGVSGDKNQKTYIDKRAYDQMVEENPELKELDEIILRDDLNAPFLHVFNQSQLLSKLPDGSPLLDHLKEDFAAPSSQEGLTLLAEDVVSRYRSYSQEFSDTPIEMAQSMREEFTTEINRLTQEAGDAGFAESEYAAAIDAHARQISSLHVNTPQKALDNLKKLKIKREGLALISDKFPKNVKPADYKKEAKKTVANLRSRAKAMVEAGKEKRTAERETKRTEAEGKALDVQSRKIAKPTKKNAQIAADIAKDNDLQKYGELVSLEDVNDALSVLKSNPLPMIGDSVDVLEGAGLSAAQALTLGVASADKAVKLETVLEALSEQRDVEVTAEQLTTELAAKVKGLTTGSAKESYTEYVGEEESQVKDLVKRSKEIKSIGDAEAIIDEMESLQFIPEETIDEIAANMGDTVLGFAEDEYGYEQTAYHGTPHEVVKFSLDRIGTGEGAQAYGYGLYFTGEKEIAEHYRSALSAGIMATLEDGSKNTVEEYTYKGKDLLDLMEKAQDDQEYYKAQVYENILLHRTPEQIASSMESGSKAKSFSLEINTEDIKGFIDEKEVPLSFGGGNTYKVDIPDSDTLLQWDAPLSQQGEILESALRKVIGDEVIDDIIELAEEEAPSDFDTEEKVIEYLTSGEIEIKDEIEFYLADAPETLAKLKGLKENAFGFYLEDDNGGDLFRYIEAITDSPREASQFFNDIGVKGHEYPAGDMGGNVPTDARNFVIWDEEAIQVLDDAVYNQQSRGRYLTQEKLIQLFQKANKSTLLHELQHNYTEELYAVINDGNKEDRNAAKQTMQTAGEWMAGAGKDRALALKQNFDTNLDQESFFESLKYGGWDEGSRAVFHEMMSEGYEQYLLEGKSPSKKMTKVFDQFRKWLTDIYKDVQRFVATGKIVELDEGIKAIFDASTVFDSEVLQGTREVAVPNAYAESLGIRKGDLKKISKIMDDSMTSIVNERNAYLSSVLKQMKPAVKKIVDETYDMQDFSKVVKNAKSKGAIDPESFSDVYGSELLEKMQTSEPDIFVEDGRDVSDVQSKANLTDDEMIQSMSSYKSHDEIYEVVKKEELAKLNVDAITISTFTSDEAIEYQAKVTSMMAKKTLTATIADTKAMAKAFLREDRTVGEASNSLHFANAARGYASDRAFLLGKSKGAPLKGQELINMIQLNEKMYLAMEMSKEAERIRKATDKQASRVRTDSKKNNKINTRDVYKIGGQKFIADRGGKKLKDDHYAMYALLAEALGFRKLSKTARKDAIAAVGSKSLSEFVDMESMTPEAQKLAESGLDIARDQASKSRKMKGEDKLFQNYKNLDMARFEQWNEVLNSVAFSGKHLSSPKGILGGKDVSIEEAEKGIAEFSRTRRLKEVDENKAFSNVKLGTRQALNYTTSLEYLLKMYTGDNTTEVNRGATKYIFEAINEVEGDKAIMIDSAMTQLEGWMEAVTAKKLELAKTHGKTVGDLGSLTKKLMNTKSFTIDELAMLPMHIGTVEGWTKLRDGYQWTDQQLQKILDDNFSAEYIQQFADMGAVLESFYAPATDVLYKLRGQKIGKKEMRSFTHGSKTFSGWYAPSTVDFKGAREAKMVEYTEKQLENTKKGAAMAGVLRTNVPMTSFEKLSDATYPLELSAAPIFGHIESTSQFITMQETLDYVRTLVEEGTEFANDFENKMGSHNTVLLNDLISNIGQEVTQPTGFADKLFDVLVRRFREAVFAGKLSIRLVQILGFFPPARTMGIKGGIEAYKALPKVFGAMYTEGKQTLLREPRAVLDGIEIYQKSKMMRQRRDYLTHNMFNKVGEMDVDKTRAITAGIADALNIDSKGFTLEEAANSVAYVGIGMVDQIASHAAWWGQYEAVKSRLLSDKVAPSEAEIQAVREADQLIRNTQDLNRDIDVVLGQKSKGLQRSLFMFASYAIRVHAQRVRLQYSYLRDNPAEFAAYLDTAKFAAMESLAPAVLGGIIRAMLRGDDFEDEEFLSNVIEDAIRDIIGGAIPVFGGMVVSPQYEAFGPVSHVKRDWNTILSSNNNDKRMWAAFRLLNVISGGPQLISGGSNVYKQIDNLTK